ncbi:MAG TPA: hypothetical protein VME17_13770 [Bryobacteraceae bacterium]|nr:hypothetical protein [Bryobacteraceae bacterium]
MSRFQNLFIQNFSLGMALAGALLFLVVCTPKLEASGPLEQSMFTFNQPVAVPGLVLPAGKYIFQLDQGTGELNVVQIENPVQDKVYGVFLVKPDYRWTAPRRPAILLEKRAAGAPLAIRAWFYPGDKFGNEFLYRKAERRGAETFRGN